MGDPDVAALSIEQLLDEHATAFLDDGERCAALREEILLQFSRMTEGIALVRERIDLDVDEFLRIKAELRNAFDGIGVTESQRITARLVCDLCDRAISAGRQRVPLIEQRDRAERERDKIKLQLIHAGFELERLRAECEQQRTRAEAAEAEIRNPHVLTDGAQENGNA